jgi:hypothetical protein
MMKLSMSSKYSSILDHFGSHGGVPEQYRRHCLMQHVQGYPGSHWTLPLGDYSLSIAPAAASSTANDMTTKKDQL